MKNNETFQTTQHLDKLVTNLVFKSKNYFPQTQRNPRLQQQSNESIS